MSRFQTIVWLLLMVVSADAARADEGMWTFDNFPSDAVAGKYGFRPTADFLRKLQLGSIRLARGCSASMVSPTDC